MNCVVVIGVGIASICDDSKAGALSLVLLMGGIGNVT